MSDFTVRSRFGDYQVQFTQGVAAAFPVAVREGDVVIIDRRVQELHAGTLDPFLSDLPVIALDATEKQKSYEELGPILQQLIEGGFRKNNRLVAIGGGITQDVTAFIASILFRGVGWVFFPTTLLAQADSCIGSKTSINFRQFKNQLGGFWPPELIVIEPGFLATLPALDFRSGLGEMCHYFLVSGESDFERFERDLDLAQDDPGVLLGLIVRSLEIKKRFIEVDELDRNERQVLNYGHSFGHAIESLTEYRVPHGVAVSYGMDIANFVSERLGYLSPAERDRMRKLLQRLWGGIQLGDIDQGRYEAALRRDKKNQDGMLGLILSRGLGRMFKHFQPLDEHFSGWLTEYFGSIADVTAVKGTE